MNMEEIDIDVSEHIRLNPEEVLAHLHSLGYHDISELQLKEFIRDLKKLIKYDMRKKKKENSRSSSGCSSSASVDGEQRRPLRNLNCCLEDSELDSCGDSASSTQSCPDSETSSQSSLVTDDYDHARTKRLAPPKKPASSFIRPRNIGARIGPPRSDPVALYHYYQKFWKQFKQPGEDEHRELRWSIRERMLGATSSSIGRSTGPTPRSSMSSLNRI